MLEEKYKSKTRPLCIPTLLVYIHKHYSLKKTSLCKAMHCMDQHCPLSLLVSQTNEICLWFIRNVFELYLVISLGLETFIQGKIIGVSLLLWYVNWHTNESSGWIYLEISTILFQLLDISKILSFFGRNAFKHKSCLWVCN